MNTIRTNEGWWIIEGDTHVGKWIIEKQKLDHDEFLIPIACSGLKLGMVVMDCGALYGDHTIAYARAVSNDGVVIAIEANPMAFDCLAKNAQLFQSPVFCMNLALGEEHGGDAVHLMIDNVGASQVTAKADVPANLPKNRIETIVKTASIDGIVSDARLERLDFIKIDCEGFEYRILRGAKATLNKFKPALLIEMNSWALSQHGACYKDIYDYLLDRNYSWRIVQPDCKGADAQYDIYAWPNLVEQQAIIKP